MTDADAILVRTLAHEDAVRLPVRDWRDRSSVNRYFARKLGAVPFRMNTAAEAGRKANERMLVDLAADRVLTVSRGPRVKFPLVHLLAPGEERARALCGLPGREVGRLFLKAVADRGRKYADTVGGRWVPEIDLNDGRGWGEDATAEDRRGLSQVELDALPAISLGWVAADSSHAGHVCYAATEAGVQEIAKPSKPPAAGKLPGFDADAAALYRREQDRKLIELANQVPADTREIGPLPLVASLIGVTQAEFDEDERLAAEILAEGGS
jgi:hypothetical protein